MPQTGTSIIADIPDPETVRLRLSHLVRETRVMRRLLKVAEAAAKERAVLKQAAGRGETVRKVEGDR